MKHALQAQRTAMAANIRDAALDIYAGDLARMTGTCARLSDLCSMMQQQLGATKTFTRSVQGALSETDSASELVDFAAKYTQHGKPGAAAKAAKTRPAPQPLEPSDVEEY